MRHKSAAHARKDGMHYAVHVLNQRNNADNGWHYFKKFDEAEEFRNSHPDPLNGTFIEFL